MTVVLFLIQEMDEWIPLVVQQLGELPHIAVMKVTI